MTPPRNTQAALIVELIDGCIEAHGLKEHELSALDIACWGARFKLWPERPQPGDPANDFDAWRSRLADAIETTKAERQQEATA